MEKQTLNPTKKSLLYAAFAFTFSDKKKLLIAILTFTIPFLFFFPVLFVGLSVQSSFLVDYHSKYPLIDPNRESIYYTFIGNNNTSLIPTNLFERVDHDIEDIVFYSGLEQYIQGYTLYCSLTLQYFSEDSFYYPLNVAFLQNDSFSFLTKYYTIANNIPSSINEAILVRNEEYSGYTGLELPIEFLSIGDNLTILPYAEGSDLLVNNTFTISPLNASISNSLLLNNFILSVIGKTDPFVSHILTTFETSAFLLYSVDYFLDFLHYFPRLFLSNKEVAIQFSYDFSFVQFKELKIIYAYAENMNKLSGYSIDRVLYAMVTNELADFLSLFRVELQNHWFKIASLFFSSLVFSFFILWLSFSYNKDPLTESYTNFITRGFNSKTISSIFMLSQFTEICLSCLLAFAFSIPLAYLNLLINSLFLKKDIINLNLISFGSVALPSIIFFIILFSLAYFNLIFLYKKIEKHFPNQLSSFQLTSRTSSNVSLLISGLTTIFSTGGIGLLLFVKTYLLHELQGIDNEIIKTKIILITNTFIYTFSVILMFSLLFFLITYLLKWLVKVASSYWKRASKKKAFILHNLSIAFQQQKRQALFIAIVFFILIQSSLIPLYLSEHASTSAKFQLGSDLSITAPSNTSQLLNEIAFSPVVSSTANFTLVQLTIFDKSYHILVLSNSSASCLFYSQTINYGIGKNDLNFFIKNNNSILTQVSDVHLNNRIYHQNNNDYINIKINNISSVPKSYIEQKIQVSGYFHVFPILLNEYQLSQFPQTLKPFLIMTELTYRTIKTYSKDIALSELNSAIIVKLQKNSALQLFTSYLDSLPYQMHYTTWLDEYPNYLPSFATSIIAVSNITSVFAWIIFLAMSVILLQDMLNQRQEKVLVFRYRGFSNRTISQIFIGECLFVLLLIIPFGSLMGIVSFILLINLSIIQPEYWTFNFPHYYLISIWLVLVFLALLVMDVLIKFLYLRNSLKFHPTIMEAV